MHVFEGECALVGIAPEPFGGFGVVAFDAAGIGVIQTHVCHGAFMALLGGLLVPFECPRVVLLHAVAAGKAAGEMQLRSGVTLATAGDPAARAMAAALGGKAAEMMKPAMIAVKMPASGFTPEAIANAIASGSATIPTVMPASTSAVSVSRL